jgi:ABC-type Mn2+/Zn2+ transport system permease subunit
MSIVNTFKNFSMSGILFFSYLAYNSIVKNDPTENVILYSLFAVGFLFVTYFILSYIKVNLKSIIFKNIILWIFVAFASNL